MSLARRSSAVKITVSTRRTTGLTPVSRVSFSIEIFSSLSSSSLDHLQRKAFGGLIEHALRLLGALQQVADLRSGGDLDLQALAEQKRELVGELQLAGVRHGDHQRGIVRLERHEVVAEHQLGGNAAEKLRVDALLAQIHEGAAIALRQAAGLLALGGVVRAHRTDRIVA